MASTINKLNKPVDKESDLCYNLSMSNDVFENYKALYQAGVSIKKMSPLEDQTYRVLASSNIDVRVIDRDKHLADIYALTSLTHFTKDTKEFSNRFFYAIPVQTVKGTIVGFIFRSVFGKSYVTVNRDFKDKDKKVPLMFGFYKDFEKFDRYSRCLPIVICEGLKDCIALKKIYPYVLANNTSSMGINLQVLSNLTNKFILVYDNDEAGQEGMKRDIRNLRNLKYDVTIVSPKSCYKDCADCYENKRDFKEFSEKLKNTIRALAKGDEIHGLGRDIVKR